MRAKEQQRFLPATARETGREPDVVIVTGDAYVDHPSFGAALVGRILEAAGARTGVIAQPDPGGKESFAALGRPRLFFGVTAGCVDSLVANRTALKARRKDDAYTPGGAAGRRPDRACVVYANRINEACPGSVIVLGGIEASTRRLAHYDYWEDRVRQSILVDAGATVVAYGMAERTVVELARWARGGRDVEGLLAIGGIVFGLPPARESILPPDAVRLPSFDEVRESAEAMRRCQLLLGKHGQARVCVQPHPGRLVVQTPPSPVTREELEAAFALPFTRRAHPSCGAPVPALDVVQCSLVSHRGCPADCSFCVLTLHQGRRLLQRSRASVLAEGAWLARQDFFRGTVTDVGGATSNMYGLSCRKHGAPGSCARKGCLRPAVCEDLVVDHRAQLELLRDVRRIPGVRHVYIGSGVRHDLVLKDPGYLDAIVGEGFVGGQLSVAPEHVSDRLLRLMGKPPFGLFVRFAELFDRACARHGRDLHLLPYFISAFPGSTLEDALALARYVRGRFAYLQQLQDFTPIPLSDAACMYRTGTDLDGNPLHVARTREEKLMQRALVQHRHPAYAPHARAALRALGLPWKALE